MTPHTRTAVSREHPDLAVVIAAWNDRENIELLLPLLKEMIADLGLTADIVAADGGSQDGTAEAD
jgi:glycosyltransferase involved in cell wall biosynthesis